MDGFHETRLPARLAFGSTGGVERRTEVTTLASGFERRSTPWALGRRRWLIGAGLRSLADMAELTAFGAAAGAVFVILDDRVIRAEADAHERGAELIWRTAPSGSPPGGLSSTETTFIWRGAALRPWRPAHLKVRRDADGAMTGRWIRRSRALGDGWDLEPPLLEEREIYRVSILDADEERAAYEVSTPMFIWTVEDQAAVFPGGVPGTARVRVRQGSAIRGWGAAAEVSL